MKNNNSTINVRECSTETARLALSLEQRENVALANGSFDVADDRAVGVVEELDAHLCALTLRSGTAENARHTSKLVGLIHFERVLATELKRAHIKLSPKD